MTDHMRQTTQARRAPAAGPLVVSADNPRYFTVATSDDRSVVYLTGSHVWNNLHDGLGPGLECADVPERNDYLAYLDFLTERGHNLIRLWRWEHVRSQVAGGFHLCMTPQPWRRTGPGTAVDGQPRFDLSRYDPEYFDRLRDRVTAAGNRGIYVSVMLFDGFGLHLSQPPDNLQGHPFYADNNVNGVGIESIVDYQVLPLDPRIQALQEAYVRHTIDTVHDLPNVLYEVANESSGTHADSVRFPDGSSIPTPVGDSTSWQYWVIDVVRRYEQDKGYDTHPIGMTMQYPVADQHRINDPLFGGPADWISPGPDDQDFNGRGRWYLDPPVNDATKVVLSDTDHYAASLGDPVWAWKTFLRGHQPILMDYGIIDVARPLDSSLGVPSFESLEPTRHAMGDTLRYARRIGLVDMRPRGDLSSTGYVLANEGKEYLILQPNTTGDPFTVVIEAGRYATEWFDIDARVTATTGEATVIRRTAVEFSNPFARPGPTALYLSHL
jgi:hypothetical protein